MKRVVVIADTGWSIHRVHKGVEAALAGSYTFKFHEARHFFLDRFMADFKEADVCLTTMNFYGDMLRLFPSDPDRRKIAIVAHGFTEEVAIPSADTVCALFTYGVTSEVLVPHFTAKLGLPVFTVPNGVDPTVFSYRVRDGSVKVLGWCGSPGISAKRIEIARSIAAAVGLELRVAATVPQEEMAAWYDSIDLLLVTSGPAVTAETGPLPPFEAIVAGVPVIGSPCGNFSFVPGPKFATVEEGVAVVRSLLADPAAVNALAAEQRDCVLTSWTYEALADKWTSMLEAIMMNGHYDFIEIGASDFDTLIQQADDKQVGLTVEPLQIYLDRLPTKSHVRKINAAISNQNGAIDIFYVPPEVIEKYSLPSWVRGCNSVGSPHKTVSALLDTRKIQQNDIIVKKTVTMMDIATLFKEHSVRSIGVLKIDTEGHDCIIMNNYIEYCCTNPHAFAKKIIFETNCLSDTNEQTRVINLLLDHGYTLLSRDSDAILVRE